VSIGNHFGKKCILCLGGYDAHWIVPDKTNTLKEKFRKFCVLKSIKYASVILPVSNWLAGFVKHLKSEDQIRVAYCCVNPRYLNDEKNPLKENWVLTVGGGGFLYETKRKKLDFFIEVGNYFSKSFPEYNAKFVLIGHNKDEITYNYLINFIKSPNVTILPPINDTAVLKEYFSKAKIYCQFSEYESFGIAVIEAMLNKTIPVVYNGGAMPEVVGDTGIVINDYDIKKTALIIKDIFDGKHDGLKAKTKQRVIDNFTTSSRKEIIFQYI
jgi:glycosyltransferase involved in cell wall biosynthesis